MSCSFLALKRHNIRHGQAVNSVSETPDRKCLPPQQPEDLVWLKPDAPPGSIATQTSLKNWASHEPYSDHKALMPVAPKPEDTTIIGTLRGVGGGG